MPKAYDPSWPQVIPSANPPSGVAERGVPPLASVLVNAYARHAGTRVRALPLFRGARIGGLWARGVRAGG
jgi:hypothetical protein